MSPVRLRELMRAGDTEAATQLLRAASRHDAPADIAAALATLWKHNALRAHLDAMAPRRALLERWYDIARATPRRRERDGVCLALLEHLMGGHHARWLQSEHPAPKLACWASVVASIEGPVEMEAVIERAMQRDTVTQREFESAAFFSRPDISTWLEEMLTVDLLIGPGAPEYLQERLDELDEESDFYLLLCGLRDDPTLRWDTRLGPMPWAVYGPLIEDAIEAGAVLRAADGRLEPGTLAAAWPALPDVRCLWCQDTHDCPGCSGQGLLFEPACFFAEETPGWSHGNCWVATCTACAGNRGCPRCDMRSVMPMVLARIGYIDAPRSFGEVERDDERAAIAEALARSLDAGERLLRWLEAPVAEVHAWLSSATGAPRTGLNQASVETLAALPGLTRKRALAIVTHRTAHGPFASLSALRDVKGIGWRTFEAVRAHVWVEPTFA